MSALKRSEIIEAVQDAIILEDHFHNVERWVGKSADQSGNNWGTQSSLTHFTAISGDGDFGSDADDEAKIVGSDDTPLVAGNTHFDAHRIMCVSASNANPFLLRLIYGTGTMQQAITAGQYSEIMVTEARKGSPIEVRMPRVASGTKMWAQAKNATDNATIDFFMGIHEYAE